MPRNLSDLDLSLIAILRQVARQRHEHVDLNEVRALMSQMEAKLSPFQRVTQLAAQMSWPQLRWQKKPDPARLPMLMVTNEGYALVIAKTAEGAWVVATPNFKTRHVDEVLVTEFTKDARFSRLSLRQPFSMRKSQNKRMIMAEIYQHKFILTEIVLSSFVITLLALATSLFAMQVYDRVLPTSAYSTLLVLAIGLGCALVLDFIGKWARHNLLQHLASEVDQNLARSTFTRFLGIRLNRLPESAGLMTQKLREYETVSQFIIARLTFVFADLPLAILVGVVLFLIGGKLVFIPLTAVIVSAIIGIIYSRKQNALARETSQFSLQKSGLLVETLTGAETIKSDFAGWRMLSRWLEVTDQSRFAADQGQHLQSNMQLAVGFLGQMSYMFLIVGGAYMVGDGLLSMGGLIACSILSQRLMAPLSSIPRLITTASFARSSLRSLDETWALEQDLKVDDNVIHVENLKGRFKLRDVELCYHGHRALLVEKLDIKAGDRVGLIGSIGSGKSSLLKLLAGLYAPDDGRVLIDDMDITRIDRQTVSQNIGYVSQDGHLFGGSLRDNLLLGLINPGEEKILQASRETGLYQYVIADHSDGLDRPIAEGGAGLSGGQKRLVLLTRAFLRQPNIWLLDEPTSSVDGHLEAMIQNALARYIQTHPEVTMVISSHKANLLNLTNRVLVMARGGVQIDEPKDEALSKLRSLALSSQARSKIGATAVQ